MILDDRSMVRFVITDGKNKTLVTPEYVGSRILATLRDTAIANLSVPIKSAVMSVPAEFNEIQRNYTRRAAALAGDRKLTCNITKLLITSVKPVGCMSLVEEVTLIGGL